VRHAGKPAALDTLATLARMGEVQRSLLSDDELPPPKGKRRRMPERLSPQLRKWLTQLARVGARITWTIELLYDPSKGGQGELCDRAKAGDHTLVLDTVREVEHRAATLAEDIEVFMTPPQKLPAEPGSKARVEAMALRQLAKMHIFD
jgi:hypothetical protein